LEALAASASSRRERRRTCSHQDGRKKLRYAELTEQAPSQAGGGRCSAGDGGGDRCPVRWEGLILFFNGEFNFWTAPRRSTRGAGLHDERDAVPRTVGVGVAELVGAAEVDLDGGPVVAGLEENRTAVGDCGIIRLASQMSRPAIIKGPHTGHGPSRHTTGARFAETLVPTAPTHHGVVICITLPLKLHL
jgi:hypothetical protein